MNNFIEFPFSPKISFLLIPSTCVSIAFHVFPNFIVSSVLYKGELHLLFIWGIENEYMRVRLNSPQAMKGGKSHQSERGMCQWETVRTKQQVKLPGFLADSLAFSWQQMLASPWEMCFLRLEGGGNLSLGEEWLLITTKINSEALEGSVLGG